jgi:hypothetical protein
MNRGSSLSRTKLLFFFLCTILFLSSPSFSTATTIVGIRTQQMIVIAADSQETLLSDRPPTSGSKIFEQGRFVYALSGVGETQGTEAEISRILGTSNSVYSAAKVIESLLPKQFEDLLLKVQFEDPARFKKTIDNIVERRDSIAAVLLATLEQNQLVLIAINFAGSVDLNGKVKIEARCYVCEDDCENKQDPFILGQRSAIDAYKAHYGLPQASIDDRARFFVQLEIDAGSPGVGPPVEVVRVDRNGTMRK